MSRRREDDHFSRYDERDRKGRSRRSRSRGAEDGNDFWDGQFLDSGSFPRAPPAPSFSQEGGSYQSAYPSYSSGIYDDFPSVVSGSSIPAAPQPPSIQWNQLMLPSAPDPAPPPPAPAAQILEEQIKKEEAIESEVRHQKATLAKQREEYTKKATVLKKELETLKDQRNELRGDSKRSPSPDSKRFLKENAKLQLEIQNKLKTINNVVDMLNGIIGENRGELLVKKDESEHSESSPERPSASVKRKSRSPPGKEKKFNYVYYDPEMHWCRICNDFPATAKDYLNHLHSALHHKTASAHLEAPWHGKPNTNEGLPNYPNAPTKRTPIRGLQFFVPSTAWYCKLCDQWIGDLHCASAHLKSIVHSKNYTNFVEQNPHWETDWMSDRQKAFEKNRGASKTKPEEKSLYTAHTITFDKDGFTKKKKEKSASPGTPEHADKKKEKKKPRKRKDTSSSSSDSEQERKKKVKSSREESDARDEKLIAQWMSSIQGDKLSEKERKMLETLKSSMNKAREKNPRREPGRERQRERERERVAQVTGQNKRQEFRDDRDRDKSKDNRGPGGPNSESSSKETSHNGDNKNKKPYETKKMPFIGKMPVFKSLSKAKAEEQKEVDQNKKQEDEVAKKKRQEVDAEIQRKVAEFKLKMRAKAEVGPPGVALPTALGGSVPPVNFTQPPPALPFPQTIHRVQKDPVLVSGNQIANIPPPTNPPPPTKKNANKSITAAKVNAIGNGKGPLHRDFQEALDIIFPAEKKPEPQRQNVPPKEQMEMNMMYPGMGPPPGPMGPPPGPMGPPFGPPMGPPFGPPMGMMPPQMNGPPPVMMGYDFNPPPIFGGPGPPQLYDSFSAPTQQQNTYRQVPMVPSPQPPTQPPPKLPPNQLTQHPPPSQPPPPVHNHGMRARQKDDKRSEMDELAMLGIDAADVGAGIH